MSHEINLILTLTGGLSAALLFGYIARRIGISPIVGYLLAGIAVGPHTPGFIADTSISAQFAEVGVILLMFGVGLHFHMKDLLSVKKFALPGALIQSSAASALTLLVCLMFGWPFKAALIFGISVSVTSTVVLTRVLEDNRNLHTSDGHIAVGWLIVEDILSILLLVLLPVAGGSEASASGAGLAWDIALIFLKLAALVILSFAAGKYIIPTMLAHVSRLKSRELFTLTILTVALGIAVGSSLLFGASMALGAFIAGMIVGQSDYGTRAASEALPMRDAFAVLFFVSVGMMFDPTTFTKSLPLLFSVLAVVLIGKPIAAFIVIRALGRSVPSSLKISSALAQIGEFTFIVASIAIAMNMMPADSMNVLVGVSIITIALNPALYRGSMRLAQIWEKKQSIQQPVEPQKISDPAMHKMIIVGYGPVGQTLHRILSDNGIHVTVIEMNLETAKKLQTQGVAVIYGDALAAETLIQAGIENAKSLIVSAPGIQGDAITQSAKALNPKIRVIIRTHFLSELPQVKKSGADAVFAGEGEIALSMSAHILQSLGATDEQIDSERTRVRQELF